MILGLDISTSITGATILDSSANMLYNESWDTRNKNKFSSLYEKAQFIRERLVELRGQYCVDVIFIEQSLQSFRSGFSSAKTLSTLSRFNGIISWMCFDIFEKEPEMIAANSARKSVGVIKKRGENAKEKVLKFVLDNNPQFMLEYTKFGNPVPGSYDRADSYVIAKAGLNICNERK